MTPSNDNAPARPRRAKSKSPRHAALAGQLLSLLRWRAMRSIPEPGGTTWMADNDNLAAEDREGMAIDRRLEVRPSIGEMSKEWGGESEWTESTGPAYAASESSGERAPRVKRRVVSRIGGLEFSNGRQEEPCMAWDATHTKLVHSSVRMPTGAIIRFNGWPPSERWRSPASMPAPTPTVNAGRGGAGSVAFADHVADMDELAHVLRILDADTVDILDLALRAANFKEIGEHLGKQGKHAERVGKETLMQACKELDEALAA